MNGSQAQMVRLLHFWLSKGTMYFSEQSRGKTYNKSYDLYFGGQNPQRMRLLTRYEYPASAGIIFDRARTAALTKLTFQITPQNGA